MRSMTPSASFSSKFALPLMALCPYAFKALLERLTPAILLGRHLQLQAYEGERAVALVGTPG